MEKENIEKMKCVMYLRDPVSADKNLPMMKYYLQDLKIESQAKDRFVKFRMEGVPGGVEQRYWVIERFDLEKNPAHPAERWMFKKDFNEADAKRFMQEYFEWEKELAPDIRSEEVSPENRARWEFKKDLAHWQNASVLEYEDRGRRLFTVEIRHYARGGEGKSEWYPIHGLNERELKTFVLAREAEERIAEMINGVKESGKPEERQIAEKEAQKALGFDGKDARKLMDMLLPLKRKVAGKDVQAAAAKIKGEKWMELQEEEFKKKKAKRRGR